MSKAKSFSDFTYGVGLELNASSFKSVKDTLKSEFDNLGKMVKAYNKMLEINPDTDLSEVIKEFKDMQTVISQIKSSSNPFSEFVDKGLLNRISTLENSMKQMMSMSEKFSEQLSASMKSVSSDIKNVGDFKFPNTFGQLFDDDVIAKKGKEIESLKNKITQLKQELNNLDDLDSGIVDVLSADNTGNNKKTFDEINQMLNNFEQLYKKITSFDTSKGDILDIKPLVRQAAELGTQIQKAFSDYDFYDSFDEKFGENIILSFQDNFKKVQSYVQQEYQALENLIQKEEQKLVSLQTKQSTSQSSGATNQKIAKIGTTNAESVGMTYSVNVIPKADASEWASIINKTIASVQDSLDPVYLRPTFSKSSKNMEKDISGNLAQLNNTVKVDFNIVDNLDQSWENIIDDIKKKIKNANEQLAKESQIKVSFAKDENFQEEFKNSVYEVVNKIKKIEASIHIKNGKKFLQDIEGIRTSAENKLKDIGANLDPVELKFNIANKDEILTEVESLRAEIEGKVQNIGASIADLPKMMLQAMMYGAAGSAIGDSTAPDIVPNTSGSNSSNANQQAASVGKMSAKAQEAAENIKKLEAQIDLLNDKSFHADKFIELGDFDKNLKPIKNSQKELEKMIQEYKLLDYMLSGTEEDIAKRYVNEFGEQAFNEYEADCQRKIELEQQLDNVVQNQFKYLEKKKQLNQEIIAQEQKNNNENSIEQQATALENMSKQAQKAVDDLKKINEQLASLKTSGFESSEFSKLGIFDENFKHIKGSNKEVRELLKEYSELQSKLSGTTNEVRNRYSLESSTPDKAISEDIARQKELEAQLSQILKNQIGYLEQKASKAQDILNKTQKTLEVEKKAEEKQKNENESSSTSTKNATPTNKESASFVAKLDSASLSELAKEGTLKGISGKLDAIVGQLKTNGKTTGNVGGAEKTSGARENAQAERDAAEARKEAAQASSQQFDVEQKITQEVATRAALVQQETAQKKNKNNQWSNFNYSGYDDEFYKAFQAWAQERAQEEGYDLAKVQAILDKSGTLVGASVGLTKNGSASGLVKTFSLITDKENEITQFIQTSTKVTENVQKYQQALDAAYISQTKLAAGYSNTVDNLKSALDPNAKNSLAGTQYEGEINKQVEEIMSLVTALRQVDEKGNIRVFDKTELADQKVVIESLINSLKQYISESQNAVRAAQEVVTATDNAYVKQQKMADTYEGKLSKIKESISPNGALAGTDYQSGVEQRISDISAQIDKLHQYNNGELVVFSTTELQDQESILKAMISDLELYVAQSKNAISANKQNEKAIEQMYQKQNSAVSTYEKQISKFQTALDPNASKTLAGTDYETDVKQKIQEIVAEVQKLDEYKDGSRVLFSTEELSDQKRIIDLMINELNEFISKSKNAQYPADANSYNKKYKKLENSVKKIVELEAQVDGRLNVGENTQAEAAKKLEVERKTLQTIKEELSANTQMYDAEKVATTEAEARAAAEQKVADQIAKQKDAIIAQNNNKVNSVVTNAQKAYNNMEYKSDLISLSDGSLAKLEKYKSLLDELKAKQQEFKNNPKLFDDEDAVASFDRLQSELKDTQKEFDSLYKASSEFLQNIRKQSDLKQLDNSFDATNMNQLQDAMQEFANASSKGQAELVSFNDAERTATYTIENARGQIQTLTVAYDQGTNSLGKYVTATKDATTGLQRFVGGIGDKFKGVLQYATSFGSFYQIISVIKQGVTYVKEIDSALTELKKVTDETDATYAKFLNNMSQTASMVGSTTSDLTNSAADWARLGYSIEEAGELAKNTAILMNVSEFDNVNDATEAMISSLQAFGYEANNSLDIVDKLNIVGNNFAISSDGIASGLQRSASTLVAAGNSLEQSIAMLAAGNKVIQDPEALGNALKVLSMRIRGTKTELEEAGEDTEGMIENTSKLRDKVLALTKVDGGNGVDILDDTGAFRSTYDILLDIANVWDRINETDPKNQAALLEILAGKTRGSQLAAILQNPKDLKAAYEDAMNSSGSAMTENARYLDSIQGKIDLFTNSVQTFWKNLIGSDLIKTIVSIGTTGMNILDKWYGKVLAIAAVVDVIARFKKTSILSMSKDYINQINSIKQAQGTLNVLNSVMPNGTPAGTTLDASSVQAYAAAVEGLTLKQQANALAATGMSRTQAELILQANGASAAEASEATAHMQNTQALNQENASAAVLLQKKAEMNAASLQEQANAMMAEAARLSATRNIEDLTKAQELNSKATELGMQAKQQQVIADFAAKAATGELTVEMLQQAVASGQITSAQAQQIISTTGLATANKGLASTFKAMIAANPVGFFLTIATVLGSAVYSAYSKNKQLQEEAINNANQEAQELQKTTSSLRDYASQVEELRGKLESGNLSEEEAYNVREQLISIQNDLVDSYGAEAGAINLVTGSINDQIAAIQELNVEKANRWLDDNSQGTGLFGLGDSVIEKAKKNVEEERQFLLGDGFDDEPFIQAFGDDAQAEYDKFIQNYEDFIKSLGGTVDDGWIRFDNATRDEVQDYVDQINQYVRNYQKQAGHGLDLSDVIGFNTSTASKFIGDDYDKHKQNYQAYLENTAIASYTDEYSAILDAQDKYRKAISDGDETAAREAFEGIKSSIQAAADAAGDDTTMANYFNSLMDAFKDAAAQYDFEDAWNSDEVIKDWSKGIKSTITESVKSLDGVDINSFLQLGKNNALDGDQASTYAILSSAAEKYGMSVEDLVNALIKLKVIQGSSPNGDTTEVKEAVKSYEMLEESVTKYNSVQTQTLTCLEDNTRLSSEYGDALKELIGDADEWSEAVDTNNGYVVKNAEAVKKAVKNAKQEILSNTKLARSQKMLQYYQLYKQMHNYVSGAWDATSGTFKFNEATRSSINALYAQMGSIQQSITKYSLLEQQLLGTTNAYTKFSEAQTADSDTDYMAQAESMATSLMKGFETAELGTNEFKVALSALVPESVYADLDTVDEKMAAIYKYAKEGDLSKFFKFEFDDDGNIQSAEMQLENIQNIIERGLGNGVFTGSDWQHFDLSEDITSLDQFAEKMGMTKEVAFAFLQNLERYDTEWLGGDFTSLLDRLVPDSLEAKAYKATTALAELDQQLASGKITPEEYAKSYADLQMQLTQTGTSSRENIKQWNDLQEQITNAKGKLETYTKELQQLKDSGASDVEIQAKTSQVEEASNYLSDLLQKLGLLEEPTEVTITLAAENVEAEISSIKQQWSSSSWSTIDLDSLIQQNDDGEYEVNVTAVADNATLTPEAQAQIQQYADLLNEQHNLQIQNEEATAKLSEVQTAAENAKEAVENIPDPSIDNTSAMNAINDLITNINTFASKSGTTVSLYENTYKTTYEETKQKHANGTVHVNGTSHASGTAYASGDWGLPTSEKNALVGELGPETVVDPKTGRYYTVGDNGAEFVDLPKGAIIFNHKQTEMLLKHGYVTSRGKMLADGSAHVEGNAHVTIWNGGYKPPSGSGSGSSSGSSSYSNDVSDAAESVEDDAEQVVDFIEFKLEEIENIITNTSNKLENFLDNTTQTLEKNNAYDAIVKAEKDKAETYLAAAEAYNKKAAEVLAEVPAQYQDMAKNGAIAIADFVGESEGKIAEAIQEYRDWASKADDAENSYLETIAEISAKRLEQLQDIADDFENITGIVDAHSSLIQSQMDLIEESGNRLSEKFYKELINSSNEKIDDLQKERVQLQNILNESVQSGDVKVGSDDWYEMVNAIYDVDDAIIECQTDIEEFQNSINDLYWDNLDKLIDRIDSVDSELSHLYNLISDDDKVVDEMGNWTSEGVTALGMLAQQLEVANYKVQQYGEAIEKLKKDYAAGLYSTDEYNEKLAELTENQWDAIEAQEDVKKSIVDLNKVRVEAVKDGIQKEIDSYAELIDKKKEELSLQKDAKDFADQVAEKQKSIAEIEKKLAVMSTDNSASAIAQKKKLQEELYNAQKELEDLYYDHSIEKQQDALDKTQEDYENQKQDEMDALDESLKNQEQIISDSYEVIKSNTQDVFDTLTGIAQQYGIDLSDAVINPWQDGINAIGNYKDQLTTVSSSFTEQLDLIKKQMQDLQAEADKTAQNILDMTKQKEAVNTASVSNPPKTPTTTPTKPQTPSAPSVGASVTVKKTATNFSRNGGNGTRMQSWVPGSTFTVYQTTGSEVLIGRNGGYTGWVKLSDIEGYAKGSKNITEDQLAILDELGEELQLVPDSSGRLSYVKKGTGIIPADLTSRLMEWGQLDPSSVLEQSKPTVSTPYITNNNMELNMNFGSLVHVDSVSQDTLPELQKMVRNEFDNCMKGLNQSLKRFTR